jgi:hypothetical protein
MMQCSVPELALLFIFERRLLASRKDVSTAGDEKFKCFNKSSFKNFHF